MFSSVSRQALGVSRQLCKGSSVCKFTPCKVLPSQIWSSSLHTAKVLCEEEKPKQLGLQGENFVQRLYNKMFGGGVPVTKLKASGYILLTHCAQRTELLKFFETFDMPDTFYSWFLVTELHVWLLGVRPVWCWLFVVFTFHYCSVPTDERGRPGQDGEELPGGGAMGGLREQSQGYRRHVSQRQEQTNLQRRGGIPSRFIYIR